VFSGVDDLEVRKDGTPASQTPPTDPSASSSGNGGGASSGFPFAGDAGTGSSTKDAGYKPARSGGTVCGAQGTWSACSTQTTFATCAAYCQGIGKSCVDNCCATDNLGDYPAKVGMYYAFGLTCSLDAVPSSASAGYCTDPLIPLGYDVRCCCK